MKRPLKVQEEVCLDEQNNFYDKYVEIYPRAIPLFVIYLVQNSGK